MQETLAIELLGERRRSTGDSAEIPAEQETEIHSLRARVCRMQDENVKCLHAIAEWKEQAAQFRVKLDQIEKALLRDSETTRKAGEQNLRIHRVRSIPM